MSQLYENFILFLIWLTVGWYAATFLRWVAPFAVNKLIARAKRTPYYDLPGYMNRYWLVPYNVAIMRMVFIDYNEKYEVTKDPTQVHDTEYFTYTDGTGLVSWRRPFTRLIQMCGIAMRIHEILRSDLGREPHDHPWWYLTIVLKVGYHEERYDAAGNLVSTKWHGPGSVLFRRANSWHKLIVPDGQTATTLFITGRKSQTWGFNVDGGKVPYHEYLNKPEKKELS